MQGHLLCAAPAGQRARPRTAHLSSCAHFSTNGALSRQSVRLPSPRFGLQNSSNFSRGYTAECGACHPRALLCSAVMTPLLRAHWFSSPQCMHPAVQAITPPPPHYRLV